jgi:hypothetical protein
MSEDIAVAQLIHHSKQLFGIFQLSALNQVQLTQTFSALSKDNSSQRLVAYREFVDNSRMSTAIGSKSRYMS